ncbi:MAG: ATP-binding protein [Nostocoides sp.]
MTFDLLALLTARAEVSLPDIARAFTAATDSAGAIIFLSDGRQLSVGAADPPRAVFDRSWRIPVGQGVAGLVARNGHAVRLGADRPRTGTHRSLLGIVGDGKVARMCLPARGVDGQILAVAAVHREVERPYNDDDLTAYQPYADMLGLRLQTADLMNAVDAHRHDRDRLIAQAISAQEAERRRIAYDLHDGVTTALASMAFHLNAADLAIPKDESTQLARSQIEAASHLADLAYQQTRAAITGLHSLVLADLGLVAALESLTEMSPPEASVGFTSDPESAFADLADHAAAAIYRMAQETVSNAIKHAQAERVALSLRRTEDAVVLMTSDDGRGFNVREQLGDRSGVRGGEDDTGHFGLSSLAERCALIGASLRIESSPGEGTTVVIELPIPSHPA